MKKTFFFLTCIIGLLSLVGCSKDESYSSSENNIKSTKIRWYGVNNPTDEPTTRGVADEIKLWNQKVGIPIKFINNPANTDMIEKIKGIATEWENYAGIKFNFVDKNENAAVRIAFDWEGNDYLTWSYTGTDARSVKNQNQPTAVFGGLQYQDEEQFKGDVLRVFGQILGLEYEQRHQEWDFWKSEAKLESYWMDMFDGMNMDWEEIREYVFTPLSGENAIYPTQTPEVDELSIMAWPYYTRTQTSKPLANYELSEVDKAFIAKLYPKENCSLPTIKEAWVDAGYFEWRDSSKTSLKITELGAKQEYLPDVSDGEQLTSAYAMFDSRYGDFVSKLKKAPFFNTSNITNFSSMFRNCWYLTSIPQLDSSKGLDFSQMFDCCSSLISIPQLNTSNGTIFRAMFQTCISLTNTPQLNTSKGKDFGFMFSGCSSLETIPFLDTSSGINFELMFQHCEFLKYIPLLDTSKGTNFNSMFLGCNSLEKIPLLNTSRGSIFNKMFYNCSSLQEKPQLDLSSATNTANMYYGTPFANTL